jgi:hypothetical protein
LARIVVPESGPNSRKIVVSEMKETFSGAYQPLRYSVLP